MQRGRFDVDLAALPLQGPGAGEHDLQQGIAQEPAGTRGKNVAGRAI